MFSVEERERIRERLVEKARQDPRIAAAAAVGSSAEGGDRWSDLDLTFGVAEGSTVAEVLADWSQAVVEEYGAAVLFDLPLNTTIYRVFLFPGSLQVDLSFTPVADFAPRGPRFKLIFGETASDTWTPPTPLSPEHEFGLAIHHVVRAHICIARGRLWQAEYWIHLARNHALTLACLRHGLDPTYGRGFDGLPPAALDGLAGSLVATMTVPELRRALAAVTTGLLREAGDIPDAVRGVQPIVEALSGPTLTE
jgi:hypothetical protein